MAGLLLFMVDIPSAWRAVRHCEWSYLAWLALWITLDRVLMSCKWRLLVVCRGLSLGHWQALKAYYLASFAGCFLPSTVGADAMRIAAVRGENRPSEVMAASVVMERTLGFLASAAAAAAACFLLAGQKADLPPGLFLWSLALMAGLGLATIFSLSPPPRGLAALLARKIRAKGPPAPLGGPLPFRLCRLPRPRPHPGRVSSAFHCRAKRPGGGHLAGGQGLAYRPRPSAGSRSHAGGASVHPHTGVAVRLRRG